MRLVIFGVTCGIGQVLLRQALENNHRVTIVLKDSSCIAHFDSRVTLVDGDVSDSASLERVIQGHDAVITPVDTPENIEALLRAMQKMQVSRFIGVVLREMRTQWFMPGVFSRFFSAQSTFKLKHLLNSFSVDWTLVRSPELTFEPPKGRVRPYCDLPLFISKHVSAIDLADFMLQQLSSSDFSCKVVSLA